MNTKVKKIMPFAIVIILLLTIVIGVLISPKTYAATTDDGLFEYTVIRSEYVSISSYLGNETTVTILSSIEGYPVTTIGNSSFRGCTSTNIIIPNSVTTIMEGAFWRCTNLTSIDIPSSVTSIEGDNLFAGCSSLKTINIDSNNSKYSNYNQDGILYNKNISTIICYPAGKTITTFSIPSEVKSIQNSAFSGCNNLSEITIPSSVTTIGRYAFGACENLTKVTMSNGVKEIQTRAFDRCTNLTQINIPNTIQTIGSEAFSECHNLESIIIPSSVTSLEASAFHNCYKLINISVDTSNNTYSNYNNDGILYNKNISKIISYPPAKQETVFTIPNSVTNIDKYAFWRCVNLKEIIIPDAVTDIGESAFHYCDNLTKITIPNSVTTINKYAFSGCSKLTSAKLSDNINSIPAYLFYNCSNLTQIIIPDNVIEIGIFAFSECSSLEEIIIPGNVTSIGSRTFDNCTNLNKIIIPINVTSIGAYAFDDANNVTIFTKSNSTAHQYALDNNINLQLDNTIPILEQPIYSTTNPTKGNVNVTITANEDIQRLVSDNRNWNYIANTNKKSITATFTENITNEQLKIKDLVGNEITTTININNIDHTAPTVTVTTDKATYKADETAIITATFNEAIQDETPKISMSGISTLAETKMTKSSDKIYTYNYVIPNKSGTQTITISGASDIAGNIMNTNSTKTFDVTPTINSIDITTAPIKTTYIEGQNFDASGMKVTANYNDGTSKEVTNYTISDGNNLAIGKTTVTVSYTENGVTKTTTQAITVSQKVLSSIRVSTSPSKTTYIEGQDFDATGMKVTATYNNGSTKEITNYTITDGNNLTTDKTSVTISYIENEITKTTTQTITVSQKTLSNIKVSTEPSKKIYIEGQNFDTDGMEVTATYDNGSTKEVTNYTITNGNNLTTDKTSVTISYTENSVTKATTQAITVVKKALTSIEITTAPAKTTYIEGQNFDATGMKVTAKYSDNSSEEITNYTITDGNDLRADKTSVTISYTESGITKTTTQPITVTKKLEISFDGYNEVNKDGNKYVDNIAPNTNLEDMINNVETNGTITVYKDNKIITDNKTKMSTGMKIKISLNNEIHEFTIVVKGDTNGDGESNLKDLLQINKHRLNKTLLTAEHLLAGDVNKDNEVNLKDLLQINKFRLGKINTL